MSSSWLRKPTTSIPVVGDAKPREQEPHSQRIGAGDGQAKARASVDLGPRAEQDLQPLPRLLTAREDDPVLTSAGLRPARHEHAVRDHLVVAGQPPALRRLRSLRHRDAMVDPVDHEPPHLHSVLHPAELARRVEGRDERAARADERRQADRRRHRLVEVQHVEALALERTHRPEVRTRREHDVRKRSVCGDDDGASHGDDVRGRLPMAPDARVQHARELARRIVSHHQAHVVA